MSARPTDELADLVRPARVAHDDEASDDLRARAVRLARARTLAGAPPRHRSNGAFAPLRRARLAFALAALALVSVLVGKSLLRGRTAAPAIAFSVGETPGLVGERIAGPTRPGAASRVLDFDDGTRVELESRGALRVLALGERGGRLLVEQGTVHAAFRHREGTYWTVEAAGIVVEVTGTRFDVSFDPPTQGFELTMHEGSVRVRGCGIEEGRVVRGTEVIRASCAPLPPVITPADLPESPVTAPPPAPARAPASAPAPAPPYAAPAVDDSLTLLQRADAERRAGDVITARATLLELRQRFPRGAGAAQASFDLGVLSFDADGRFADAARWFRIYLDEAPRGPLVREALGRAMEAQSRQGDAQGAASSAARYLESYPGGPHASLAKRLVAQRP